MIRVGMDLGSSAVKTIVLKDGGAKQHANSERHYGDISGALLNALAGVKECVAGEAVRFALTGGQAKLFEGLSSRFLPEIPAAVAGALLLDPKVCSIVEIGSQQAKYITGFSPPEQKNIRFFTNSSCSAGTGSFLEEQASRLEISLEELSEIADRARHIPRIAGRCSVFSKTDMIHHQQEGAGVEDILMGLVFAMVRNYKANVLQKRRIERPVMLTGGVMRIAGVVRALKEIFTLSDEDVLLPEDFLYVGALGAAVTAGRDPRAVDVEELIRIVDTSQPNRTTVSTYTCLQEFGEGDTRERHTCTPASGAVRGTLGIDVGSTSINLVLIDEDENVLAYRYLRTRGQPTEVVEAGLQEIRDEFGSRLEIIGTATTGSGRSLIGKRLDADVIIDEITAQARGAYQVDARVDTVFEIGGQDSKYIRIDKGTVVDFEMNKICAAGTGSFLEAQAEKIGVPLDQFSSKALAGENPVDLGDRCTVFIEGSIANALARGERTEDVVSGLSYAIVHNYLNRVVGNRPVGDRILLQGGIAYNQAVVNAFRAVLGKPVQVPPFFSTTGALGAAVIALEKSRERGAEKERPPVVQDFWEESKRLFLEGYTGEVDPNRKTVGIPRVLFMHKLFVLFNEYFKTLGFNVILSDETDSHIVSLSQKHALEETCYAVKLVNGHVASLIDKGVDYIFLPSLFTMKHEVSKVRKDYACAYMQQVSALMDHGMDLEKRGIKLLSPRISFKFGKRYMAKTIFGLGRSMGKGRLQTARAMKNGFLRLKEFNRQLEELGKRSIDSLADDEIAFVMITRPYGVNDPELNMGIPQKLMAMGYKVLSISALPVLHYDTFADYPNMFWPFGQHILAAAQIIRNHPKLYAIYLTNHGCGPDLMLNHYFEKEMEGKPYLHLEVDEHSSEVGIATRLEAFASSFRKGEHKPPASRKAATVETSDGKLFIPHLFPYSHLFSELLKRKGIDAQVMPLTSEESFEKGRRLSRSKEYLSHVSLVGDVLHQAEKSNGERIRFWLPKTEGTENFGQYENLIRTLLDTHGYNASVESPFQEDLLADSDYGSAFVHTTLAGDILMASDPVDREPLLQEMISALRQGELTEAELLTFASRVQGRSRTLDGRKRVLIIGEPLVVFNAFNHRSMVEQLEKESRLFFSPLTESLYFMWSDYVRTGKDRETRRRLPELQRLLTDVSQKLGDHGPFDANPEVLLEAADGRLPLFSGGNGRYRLAKILRCGSAIDGIISMESMYMNSGIVVMQLAERNGDPGQKPLLSLTFDGSAHNRHEDLVGSFLHCL